MNKEKVERKKNPPTPKKNTTLKAYPLEHIADSEAFKLSYREGVLNYLLDFFYF